MVLVRETVLKYKGYVEKNDIEQATTCLSRLQAISGIGSPYQMAVKEFYQQATDHSPQYDNPKYQEISKDIDQLTQDSIKVIQYVEANKVSK